MDVRGIKPLDDKRGLKDSRGFLLNATVMATADQVASAAGLLMDKNSRTPIIIIRGLNFKTGNKGSKSLIRESKNDLFR